MRKSTEQRFEEFDEMFGDVWKITEHTEGQSPKLERQNRQIKVFIAEAIHQSEKEMIKEIQALKIEVGSQDFNAVAEVVKQSIIKVIK